jgi:hypothetical protein
MVDGFGKSPEREKILLDIGRAAQSGARLELRLSVLAGALLALPQRTGIFILGRESASRLFTILNKTVAIIEEADVRERLCSWLASARQTYERRNGVIHAQILHDPNTGRLYWNRFSGALTGLAFRYELLDIGDLQSIGQLLDSACDQFDSDICSLLISRLPYTRQALGHPA